MDPVTIRWADRVALHWLCWLKTAAIGDIFTALENGDVNQAQELRRDYRDVTRLLDDLGWKEDQTAEAFAITMEPDALLHAVMLLHERAVALLTAHAHGAGDGPVELENAVNGVTACDALLIRLASMDSCDDPVTDRDPSEGVAITILRNERRALWHVCFAQMATIDDIFTAFDRDDASEALTLRNRYRDVMRLLDDIGWREEQPGEQFAITIEPGRLVRVLLRLHETAVEMVAEHIDPVTDRPPALQRAAVGVAVCGTLLTQLACANGTPAGEVPS
jgi:hypothetical protein